MLGKGTTACASGFILTIHPYFILPSFPLSFHPSTHPSLGVFASSIPHPLVLKFSQMQPQAGRAVPKFSLMEPPPPIACGGETVANLPPALGPGWRWADGLDETGGASQLSLSPAKLQMDLLLKKKKRNESKPEHMVAENKLPDLGGILALGVSECWEGGCDKIRVCSDFPTSFELCGPSTELSVP